MSLHAHLLPQSLPPSRPAQVLPGGDPVDHSSLDLFPGELVAESCPLPAMVPPVGVHGGPQHICLHLLHRGLDPGQQLSVAREHGCRDRAEPQLLQFLPSSWASHWWPRVVIRVREEFLLAPVPGMGIRSTVVRFNLRLVILSSTHINTAKACASQQG